MTNVQKNNNPLRTFFKKVRGVCAVLFEKKHESIQSELNFIELMRLYYDKQLCQNTFTKSTASKYQQLTSNITRFLSETGLLSMRPVDFKLKIADSFVSWLHKNLDSCGRTHSSRHIEFCKRVLNYGVRMEYIEVNPLQAYESSRDPIKQVVHLDLEEISLLYSFNFNSELLRRVCDMYLFQCETGLSYADLYSFEITKDDDGSEWIHNCRKKSNKPYWVPFFPQAKYIYQKYSGKLPRYTNAAYNRVLKEIAAHAGINKHLTSHTARKTFATLKNNVGYTTEAIRDMLGQSSVQVTEAHYILRDKKRIIRERSLNEPILSTPLRVVNQ
ncbi:MAG TPA: site-specific integrase [Bacteroidia bacterium]|jgi:integrase/recombinase XerD|nr:site-specific integrase [Bacteroidia bacterium]